MWGVHMKVIVQHLQCKKKKKKYTHTYIDIHVKKDVKQLNWFEGLIFQLIKLLAILTSCLTLKESKKVMIDLMPINETSSNTQLHFLP